MKRLLVFLLVVLTLTLSLSGCGYSEAELTESYNEGYSKGYEAGYEEGRAILTAPEGSVINTLVSWTSKTYEDCTKVFILVHVMNVGGDGTFTVHVEVKPREGYINDKVLEPRYMSTRVYLKTGEVRELQFDFYIKGGYEHRAWCTTP